MDDNFWQETARSDYLYYNKKDMCDLKAAQIHERPFSTVKDHVQPLAALDSFLPNGKKNSDLTPFIIPAVRPP